MQLTNEEYEKYGTPEAMRAAMANFKESEQYKSDSFTQEQLEAAGVEFDTCQPDPEMTEEMAENIIRDTLQERAAKRLEAQTKQEAVVIAEAEKMGVNPEDFVRMGRDWNKLVEKGWDDARKRKFIKAKYGVEINPDL